MTDAARGRPIARAFVATLALVLCSTLAASALAGPANPKRQALLDGTVRFLQNSQQQSGGFAKAGEPTQGTSAWVALALAGAGINPRNQAKPCGTDAYGYLVTHFREATGEEIAASEGQIATTAFERELMVVNASGTDPHDFAGFDLVDEILERQLPDSSFPYTPGKASQVNTTIFAILALSPVHEPEAIAAIEGAAAWLIAQQNDDGGWYWQGKGAVSEVDMTGAAIEALNAAGPPSAPAKREDFEEAQREGFEYLEDAQLPDGGFPALPSNQNESNVASTAWAVQGIWSAGGNPETWRTGSGGATEEPLDYMESLQQPDGHVRWQKSSDLNGIWMTAYVAPAFAGQALPIPQATYSNASIPPCDPSQDDGASGAGGKVIAGGGGNGAPLFSRPKPQSKGKTPGGARVIHNKSLHPRNHSQTRRGANTTQPTGTETSEPSGPETTTEGEITAVGSSAGSAPGNGSDGPSSGAHGPGSPSASDAPSSPSAGTKGAPLPPALRESARNAAEGSGGREISGTVIGSTSSSQSGDLAFGAPGLQSDESGSDQEQWLAIGIGGAVLLVVLGGAQWERRRQELIL